MSSIRVLFENMTDDELRDAYSELTDAMRKREVEPDQIDSTYVIRETEESHDCYRNVQVAWFLNKKNALKSALGEEIPENLEENKDMGIIYCNYSYLDDYDEEDVKMALPYLTVMEGNIVLPDKDGNSCPITENYVQYYLKTWQ